MHIHDACFFHEKLTATGVMRHMEGSVIRHSAIDGAERLLISQTDVPLRQRLSLAADEAVRGDPSSIPPPHPRLKKTHKRQPSLVVSLPRVVPHGVMIAVSGVSIRSTDSPHLMYSCRTGRRTLTLWSVAIYPWSGGGARGMPE